MVQVQILFRVVRGADVFYASQGTHVWDGGAGGNTISFANATNAATVNFANGTVSGWGTDTIK